MPIQNVVCTVVGLQDNPIAAGAPAAAGAVLTWNGSAWAPGGIAVSVPSLTVIGTSVFGGQMQLAANLMPGSNTTYNIGSAVLQWNNIYCVAVTQSSDPRLKKHIHFAGSALGAVNSLPVRTYRFKTEGDDDPVHWGFLTTEVEEVMGQQFAAVKTGDDPDHTQTLAYTEMIGVLWRAVQELTDIVRNMQDKSRRSALSN